MTTKETTIQHNGDTYIIKSKYDYDLYEAKHNRDIEIKKLKRIIKELKRDIEILTDDDDNDSVWLEEYNK